MLTGTAMAVQQPGNANMNVKKRYSFLFIKNNCVSYLSGAQLNRAPGKGAAPNGAAGQNNDNRSQGDPA